jgi:virginiamycin B lyase
MSDGTSRRAFPAWSWPTWTALVIVVALVIGSTLFTLVTGPSSTRGFEELRLPNRTDIPVAIAAAPDGTVWFTLESSNAIGRLRNGRVERIPKATESIEPLGLAVDAEGRAWYTEAPKQSISRASPDGAIASFGLSTPVARLGRLTVGPDSTVWFAEPTLMSVTRLQDGRFTRYVIGTLTAKVAADAAPFGVAIAPDGAVWATLPSSDQLVRIAPDGNTTAFDVPTRNSGLGDIVVAPNGAVYFLEMTGNRIGHLVGGRFEEFAVPTPRSGLMALAVAPDGAAWFTELRGHRLGRLRDGTITEFELPRRDARPFGITVDGANNVWYSDLSGWLGRLDAARAAK